MTTPEVRLAALSAGLAADPRASGTREFADLAALLAPISETAPAGEWLRYDPAFDALREARREEDPTTPQGIWARDLKRAEWTTVHALASDLLAHRSKDIQIAAWLLEAWVKLYGFAGMRTGLALIASMCETYWPDLHPLPDEDDHSARIATVEWINERMPARILDVPLTQPSDPDSRAWSWGDRVEALRRENVAKRAGKQAKPAAGGDAWLTVAKFASSVGGTPRAVLARHRDDLGAAIENARALEAQLDRRCGANAPSLTRLIELMSEIRRFVAGVVDERGADASSAAVASSAPSSPSPSSAAATAGESQDSALLTAVMTQTTNPPAAAAAPLGATADHAATRTEAYRKLAEAADTLMRIEPHSPTPYLVRRAIAWGGMSLAELMKHFIDSGYDLKSLYSMLGMNE